MSVNIIYPGPGDNSELNFTVSALRYAIGVIAVQSGDASPTTLLNSYSGPTSAAGLSFLISSLEYAVGILGVRQGYSTAGALLASYPSSGSGLSFSLARLTWAVNVLNGAVSGLLPLDTIMTIEGDSNSQYGFSIVGWAKIVQVYTGARFYSPFEANMAVAGSTAGRDTGGTGSPWSRRATSSALIAKYKALGHHVVMCIAIGSNAAPGGVPDTQAATEELFADWQAAGVDRIVMLGCPYHTNLDNMSYADGVNAYWASIANGSTVFYVDPIADCGFDAATDHAPSDNVHWGNTTGHPKLAQGMANKLLPLISADLLTDETFTSTIAGTMAGTGGTGGVGSAGVFATGWNGERDIGDGTVTGSKPSANKQRLTCVGGTQGSFFNFSRSDACTKEVGDYDDTFVTMEIISSSSPTAINQMGIDGAEGYFPNNVNAALSPTIWTGPYIYRASAFPVATAGSTTNTNIAIQVNAGETVVVDIWDTRGRILIPAAPAAPVIVTAPQITLAVVGSPIAWSAAVVTGHPTPTVAYTVFVNGVSKGSSYTPVSGDLAENAVVTALASNGVGSPASASSDPVAITAPSASGTTWDTAVAPFGALVYSNGNYTVATTGPFAGSNNYGPVALDPLLTGKAHAELSPVAGVAQLQIANNTYDGFGAGGILLWDFASGNVFYASGSTNIGSSSPARAGCDIDADAKEAWLNNGDGVWHGPYDLSPNWAGGAYFGCRISGDGASAVLHTTASEWTITPQTGFNNPIT